MSKDWEHKLKQGCCTSTQGRLWPGLLGDSYLPCILATVQGESRGMQYSALVSHWVIYTWICHDAHVTELPSCFSVSAQVLCSYGSHSGRNQYLDIKVGWVLPTSTGTSDHFTLSSHPVTQRSRLNSLPGTGWGLLSKHWPQAAQNLWLLVGHVKSQGCCPSFLLALGQWRAHRGGKTELPRAPHQSHGEQQGLLTHQALPNRPVISANYVVCLSWPPSCFCFNENHQKF